MNLHRDLLISTWPIFHAYPPPPTAFALGLLTGNDLGPELCPHVVSPTYWQRQLVAVLLSPTAGKDSRQVLVQAFLLNTA